MDMKRVNQQEENQQNQISDVQQSWLLKENKKTINIVAVLLMICLVIFLINMMQGQDGIQFPKLRSTEQKFKSSPQFIEMKKDVVDEGRLEADLKQQRQKQKKINYLKKNMTNLQNQFQNLEIIVSRNLQKDKTLSYASISNIKDQLKRMQQIEEQLKLIQQYLQIDIRTDIQEQKYQYYRYPHSPRSLNRYPTQSTPLYIPDQQELKRYDKKKDLIITTLAGRKAYLQILYKSLLKQRNSFFQWRLWFNTVNPEDVQYMNKLAKQNNWIKLIKIQNLNPNNWVNYGRFWKVDCQKDKVYLRIDDDVVWMSDDFVQKMFDLRIKYPEFLMIYPSIINNGIVNYLHQRAGTFDFKEFTLDYDGLGNSWGNPWVARQIHMQFLDSIQKNQTKKWTKSFTQWTPANYQRISINSIIYFSNTLQSIKLQIQDEQQLFSSDLPYLFKRKNLIVNYPLCVHQAFSVQRKFIDRQNPEILKRYRKIAGL